MFLNKKGLTWRTHPYVLPPLYHLVSATSLFSVFFLNTVKEIFKNLPKKFDFGDIYALLKGVNAFIPYFSYFLADFGKISCRSSGKFHEIRFSERHA